MSDFQAIIDFSFQLNKFVNIDLFQRGLYQIRLQLKLPNCKVPHRVEVLSNNTNNNNGSSQQSHSKAIKSAPKSSRLKADFSNGNGNLTLSSSSSSLTSSTTTTAKTNGSSSKHSSSSTSKKHSSRPQKGSSSSSRAVVVKYQLSSSDSFSRPPPSGSILYPGTVLPHSNTAISSTFQIVYKNEEVQLNDAAPFRVHLVLDANDCREQVASKISFLLVVELWFTEQEEEEEEVMAIGGRRNGPLEQPQLPAGQQSPVAAAPRPVPCAVTLTVHAALVTLCAPSSSLGSASAAAAAATAETPMLINGGECPSSESASSSEKGSSGSNTSTSAAWLSSLVSKSELMKEEKRMQENGGGSAAAAAAGGGASSSTKSSLLVRRLQLAQWRLVSLMGESLVTLRRKVDEYYKLLPPWQQARIHLHSLLVDITEDSTQQLSELSRNCLRRLTEQAESGGGSGSVGGDQSEETMLATVQRDIAALCSLTADQWSRLLRLASHSERINQHLAKRHHLSRIRRFAEGFFTAELPRSDLYALTDETSARWAELSEAVRKSAYLARLPPCSVECLPMDGDASTLPVIFEQQYESMSSTEEVAVISRRRSFLRLEALALNGNSGNSSVSKHSLSSPTSSSTTSTSTSSNSSSNKNNIRSLLSKLNYVANGADKSAAQEIQLMEDKTVAVTTSSTTANSSAAIDLLGLYGTDLFAEGDGKGGEGGQLYNPSPTTADSLSVNRRIKLLNSLLYRKEHLLKSSYSKLYSYSERKQQKEQFMRTAATASALAFSLHFPQPNFPTVPNHRSITLTDETGKDSGTQSWPNLTQQQQQQHKSTSSSSRIGKSKSDSVSLTDDQVMRSGGAALTTATSLRSLNSGGNGAGGAVMRNLTPTFQGTMYFPKPPKEFASIDEPTEEVDVKAIPRAAGNKSVSSKQPQITLSSEHSDDHHHQHQHHPPHPHPHPHHHANGQAITSSSTPSAGAEALLLLHSLDSLKLKGSSSCQDLTERLEREKARVEKAKAKLENVVAAAKAGNQAGASTAGAIQQSKDDAYLNSSSSTRQQHQQQQQLISISSSTSTDVNKFTFLELLRSDHCLLCSGSLSARQGGWPATVNSAKVQAAVDSNHHSWPCVCTTADQQKQQQQQQQQHQQKKKAKAKHQQQQQQSVEAASSQSSVSTVPPASSPANSSTDAAASTSQVRRLSATASGTADLLSFLTAKEAFRNGQPLLRDKSLLFYSDFHTLASRIPYFQCDPDFRAFNSHKDLHLIVCVHGLDGNSADLRLVRTYLELGLETLTSRLVAEIDTYVAAYCLKPARISFIGHSLGNIIIRSAISRHDFIRRWGSKMHTFLSLSGPHLGLAYNRSGLVNMGLWFIQKFKKSASLTQLSMKDAPNIRQTFLYQLSTKPGLEHFRHVLLCGSSQDYYVPIHSAHIELCNAALADSSDNGVCYREMANNILERLLSRSNLNIVRYDVHHALSSNANSLIGRAAHIAVLDSELFIEKFMVVVGLKYFV
ncbi:hypothetical protein TYRP_002720 [Tyrophagus putrescentiae]|nr:hypothetical protein TYRP_002720 [Tyrophagus putrescentiae]